MAVRIGGPLFGAVTTLSYLLDDTDQRDGAFDLELEVLLLTPCLRERGLPAHRLSVGGRAYGLNGGLFPVQSGP